MAFDMSLFEGSTIPVDQLPENITDDMVAETEEGKKFYKSETNLMVGRVKYEFNEEDREFLGEGLEASVRKHLTKTIDMVEGVFKICDRSIIHARDEVFEIILEELRHRIAIRDSKMKRSSRFRSKILGEEVQDNEDDDMSFEKFLELEEVKFSPVQGFRCVEGTNKYYLEYPEQTKLLFYKNMKNLKFHKHRFVKVEEFEARKKRKKHEERLALSVKNDEKIERRRAERAERKRLKNPKDDDLEALAQLAYYEYLEEKKWEKKGKGEKLTSVEKRSLKLLKKRKKKLKKNSKTPLEFGAKLLKTMNDIDDELNFSFVDPSEIENITGYINIYRTFCKFGIDHHVFIPELRGVIMNYDGPRRVDDKGFEKFLEYEREVEEAQALIDERRDMVEEQKKVEMILEWLQENKTDEYKQRSSQCTSPAEREALREEMIKEGYIVYERSKNLFKDEFLDYVDRVCKTVDEVVPLLTAAGDDAYQDWFLPSRRIDPNDPMASAKASANHYEVVGNPFNHLQEMGADKNEIAEYMISGGEC